MVRKRTLTDDERAFLRENYPGELTIPELAKHLGCGVGVVTRELREMGIATRRSGWQPKLTPEKRTAILAAWRQGKATNAINRELGTSTSTVKAVLAAEGIPWENRLGRGPASPGWKGGRIHYGPEVNGSRYVAVWVAEDDPMRVMAFRDGYVPEHRLVMARSLGRPLDQHETVHHVNGRRGDNRLANLQLRNGRHGKGIVMRCLDCGSHNVAAVKLGDPGDTY